MEQHHQELPALLATDLDGHFGQLMSIYQHRLYAFALRQAGNAQDAEDIVQEAFLRAYHALKNYPVARIRTLRVQQWLYKITLNIFRNRARRSAPQPVQFDVSKDSPLLATEDRVGGPPLVANGIVYFRATNIDQSPDYLEALRASDGTLLWHYLAPGDKNNGVGLLAVAGGLVYIDTTAGPSKNIFSALRASDGSLLWSYPTGDPAVNVLVIDGVAYLAVDGTIDTLRITNGTLLWHYTIVGQVNTPLIDGSTVYIGASNGIVYALQASTGVLRWSYLTKVS